MKILHLTPQMGAGGAERQTVNLIQYLRRSPEIEQHLVIIYAESIYPFFFREQAGGIPVTFLNKQTGKLSRLPMAWRYAQIVRQFQPQIVHAHQWYAMDLARVFHHLPMLSWKNPPKIIAQTQNQVIEDGAVESEKRYWQWADRILVVSQAAYDQYRALIPEAASRLRLIPNGVDTRIFSPSSRAEARQKLGILPEMHLALLPARITPQKNQLGLARAVKNLVQAGRWPASAQILCVGDVHDDSYAAEIQQVILANHLHEILHIRPAVPNLLTYYHAADFLLLPSAYEGLPLTLLEAGACARPALVSHAANTARIIQDGVSGWVTDEEALEATLLRAFSTPPHVRDAMGQAAFEQVISNYTMESIADKYVRLYQQLLGQ